MQAQLGALDVHIVIAGAARFGSSKVPTRTKIRCGRASASLKSGVPQSGQKRRCIRFPLSAALAKSLVRPVTLNVAVPKHAPTVPLPAPRYWQSRHQHTRVVIGGSTLSQRTAPQRHPPVTVIASPSRGTRKCCVAHPTLARRLMGCSAEAAQIQAPVQRVFPAVAFKNCRMPVHQVRSIGLGRLLPGSEALC